MKRSILLSLLLAASSVMAADLARPAAVKAAVAYEVPAFPCDAEPPRTSGDPTTMERRRRKAEKQLRSCIEAYHARLQEDFLQLKDSARHGLTQAEAEVILLHLGEIQHAIEATTPRAVAGLELDRSEFSDRAHGS